MTKVRWMRTLNALLALILMGVILAAYYQQYFKHAEPCPLCFLQRLAMIGTAVGALMNLRFGIHPRFYAMSLLSAFFGRIVSLRQISLHVCPDFPEFGLPVFGFSLYTWAYIVFASAVVAVIWMLFLYSPKDSVDVKMNLFEKVAFAAVFLLILMNVGTVLNDCGFGVCSDVP